MPPQINHMPTGNGDEENGHQPMNLSPAHIRQPELIPEKSESTQADYQNPRNDTQHYPCAVESGEHSHECFSGIQPCFKVSGHDNKKWVKENNAVKNIPEELVDIDHPAHFHFQKILPEKPGQKELPYHQGKSQKCEYGKGLLVNTILVVIAEGPQEQGDSNENTQIFQDWIFHGILILIKT